MVKICQFIISIFLISFSIFCALPLGIILFPLFVIIACAMGYKKQEFLEFWKTFIFVGFEVRKEMLTEARDKAGC